MDASALMGMLAGARRHKLKPAALLQQLASESSDPEVTRLVGAFMAQQDDDDREDDDGTPSPSPASTDRLWAAIRDLQAHVTGIADEVARTSARLEAVAEALGACPECWGTNPDCDLCGGRGRPGTAAPSRATAVAEPSRRRAGATPMGSRTKTETFGG